MKTSWTNITVSYHKRKSSPQIHKECIQQWLKVRIISNEQISGIQFLTSSYVKNSAHNQYTKKAIFDLVNLFTKILMDETLSVSKAYFVNIRKYTLIGFWNISMKRKIIVNMHRVFWGNDPYNSNLCGMMCKIIEQCWIIR